MALGFHPLVTREQREADGNTREFSGNGTPYLKVPGCRGVTAVRVSGTPIPMTISQEVPVNANMQLERQVSPLVILETGTDGVPVLLRGIQSNNGYWQDGATIYVTGEWDEKAAEETKSTEGDVQVAGDRTTRVPDSQGPPAVEPSTVKAGPKGSR